jgi:hypothetical protein
MRTRAKKALAVGAGALWFAFNAATVAAQTNLDPTELGPQICVPSNVSSSAPGLYGAPDWPDTQFTTPAGQVRGDVYDPRWGSAPRLGFVYDGRPEGHSRYRILRDTATNELVVSIQVHDDMTADNPDTSEDESGASASDKVYFGVAGEAGDFAKAIVIPVYGADDPTTTVDDPSTPAVNEALESARGQFIKPDWSGVVVYNFSGGASGSWDGGTQVLAGGAVTLPSWIKDIRLWNTAAERGNNGGAWTVQFRVVLAEIPIELEQRLKLNFGARVIDENPRTAVFHAVPNTSTGCTRDASTPAAGFTGVCTNLLAGVFHRVPNQWALTQPLNTECTGIDIQSRDLYTNHPNGNNLVRTANGQANQFFMKATMNGQAPAAEELQARLRIANWGTVADPQAGWFTLFGRNDTACTDTDPLTICPNSLLINNPADIIGEEAILEYPCSNRVDSNSDGQNVCDQQLNTSIHQCIQAELSPAPGVPLQFERATAWNNMYFTSASEVTETATVSNVGLQRIFSNANQRDIYLHVVTYNMPAAGSAPLPEVDVEALEALRTQIEPNYQGGDYCQIKTDLCVPVEEGGVCAYLADDDCGELEQEVVLPDESLFCITTEACQPVPGGGYNPILTSMDKDQVLTTNYPTIVVNPYYDSGKTQTIDGLSTKILIPMYSFGLHVDHEGDLYGWLNEITGGANVTKLRPDLYLVRMNNETRQNVAVNLSAEEEPHYGPLTQIAGMATTFGFGFDTVNITGVTKAKALNLRTSSVSLSKVLYEKTVERVQSLRAPRALARRAGATATRASYASSGSAPHISMEVIDLPIIGRTINMTVTGARVTRPTSCGFFGTTMLTTAFAISDGSTSQSVSGEDQWSCVPTTIFNY